jgi:hypothetical protein
MQAAAENGIPAPMSEKQRPKSILGVIFIVLGASVLSLVATAVVGMAGVAVVFCDAPGLTPGDCLLAGARGGFEMTAPRLLPLGLGFVAFGMLLHYLSGRPRSA